MNATKDRIFVLHVDDEPNFADMAAEFLERTDDRIVVQTVTSPQEGLGYLADSEVDCIVSDYNMPGMDGIEFLETIRDTHPDLPYILFTGKGSEEVASEAISAGVTDYLQKESGTEQYEILANEIRSSVQKHRTEQELDQLRRQYTKIVEQNLVGIYIIQNGTFEYVNPRLAEIHGYDTPDEIIGMSPLELVAPSERQRVQTNLEQRISGPKQEIQYRTNGLCRDGELVEIELHGSSIEYEGDQAVIGAELDLTERKEREQYLETYQLLFENTNDCIIRIETVDGEPLVRDVNAAFEETFGYDREQLIGESIDPFIVPEDLEDEADRLNQRVVEEDYLEAEVTRMADDGPREFLMRSADYEGNEGYILYTDITERKEYERELRELKERYQTFVEYSSDIVTVVDTDGTVTYQNPAVERILGVNPESRVGESVIQHVHPKDRQKVGERFAELVEEGRNLKTRVEFRYQDPDGSYRWLESIAVDRTDTLIDGYVIYSRDISERKEREEQLRREKERLDDFASVVSHDLRNPLNVSQGRINLAREECDTDHLNAAAEGIERGFELIEDMLALARTGEKVSDKEPIEMSEFVESCWETVETYRATMVADVESRIRADRSRLCQLFENLFRNAVEHGGEDVTVTIGPLPNGFFVADDGSGIPVEDRIDIFEPGYSENPSGTGFGLSIVKQIVVAHGWDIHLVDGSEDGARFEITGLETISE